MNKLETAKAFISEIEAVMHKYGMEEMIVVTYLDNSLIPAFVQEDPSKDSPRRNFMRTIYATFVDSFSRLSDDATIHASDNKGQWERKYIKPN